MGGRPIYSALLGLSGQSPPRAPFRRITLAAVILGAFIALEQIDIAWQGTGMGAVTAVAEQAPAAPAPHQPPATIASTEDTSSRVKAAVPPHAVVARLASVDARAPARLADEDRGPDRIDAASTAEAEKAHGNQVPRRTPPPDAAMTDAGAEAPAAAVAQTRYSIQLISFRQPASLMRFAREQGLIGKASTLDAAGQAQSWYAVLVGDYPTLEAAQAAVTRLPAQLQRLAPIVRTLPPGTQLTPIDSLEDR
jgi:septal ring-binding cell division protein DamX